MRLVGETLVVGDRCPIQWLAGFKSRAGTEKQSFGFDERLPGKPLDPMSERGGSG